MSWRICFAHADGIVDAYSHCTMACCLPYSLTAVRTADAPSKAKVLQALTRKFQLAVDVDLAALSQRCAATFTGADMYALASDAWMHALKRTVSEQVTRT